VENFDMDKAVKLWDRAQNVVFEPHADEVWEFLDLEREQTVIEWLIESISEDGKSVTVVKKSGEDTGYRVVYPIDKLQANRWRKKEGTPEQVLWPCPNCERDKPVPLGDYICEDCRKA
jgi:hypothetical protein